MKTQNDLTKGKGSRAESPGSLFTQETLQQHDPSTPPFQQLLLPPFRQPPMLPPPRPRKYWFWMAIVVLTIALLLSLGALASVQLRPRPGSPTQATPTTIALTPTTVAPTPPSQVTPTQAPKPTPTPVSVQLGPQACPTEVHTAAYWDRMIGTQPGVTQVSGVSCASMRGTSATQTLVTVKHKDMADRVDVYVYEMRNGKPVQLFTLTGLYQGDAKISGYSTVMTAEVDVHSPLNKDKSATQMTRDLFREFAWNSDKNAFVQVAFPGIFPDLTRYQAEADQESVNRGHESWKNDPSQVTRALVARFLQWNDGVATTLVSGGGVRDVDATVRVMQKPRQGAIMVSPLLNVKLSRLEGKTQNIWVVIGVDDGSSLTLTNIPARSLISSPVTLQGKGGAFEAEIGNALVLDHLYNEIGHARITSPGAGMGLGPYSTSVTYGTTFQGIQEGIVEVQQSNGGISTAVRTAVMVKVLLNPAPEGTPTPTPVTMQDPAYWNPLVDAQSGISQVRSVSLANLKGDTSLQAVVQVFYQASNSVGDIYVFDRINDAHPTALFKLQGLAQGSAAISGYKTLMTAQADIHSPLNTGKPVAQMQQDVFREFQWDAGQGKFV